MTVTLNNMVLLVYLLLLSFPRRCKIAKPNELIFYQYFVVFENMQKCRVNFLKICYRCGLFDKGSNIHRKRQGVQKNETKKISYPMYSINKNQQ